MKNFDFKKNGIEALSFAEKKETNGGWVWTFSWRIYRPENLLRDHEESLIA